MRLLLIRHGQTPNNVAGAMDTAFPGAALTALGEAQAAAIPEALAAEDVRGVYASRLVRTQLTGEPLGSARGGGVRVREGLEEIAAGDLEMHTGEESVRTYIETVAGWAVGDLDRRMPGGHTGRDFFARYDAALRAIAAVHAPDDTVAAVSHGAAIRLFTAVRCRNVSSDHVLENRLANTGMAVLLGDPESGWELERWHDEPLGGPALLDTAAHDVTGESRDEALTNPPSGR